MCILDFFKGNAGLKLLSNAITRGIASSVHKMLSNRLRYLHIILTLFLKIPYGGFRFLGRVK